MLAGVYVLAHWNLSTPLLSMMHYQNNSHQCPWMANLMSIERILHSEHLDSIVLNFKVCVHQLSTIIKLLRRVVFLYQRFSTLHRLEKLVNEADQWGIAAYGDMDLNGLILTTTSGPRLFERVLNTLQLKLPENQFS